MGLTLGKRSGSSDVARKTALLLFHGIGEQRPFETLDAFVRTFWRVLESRQAGPGVAGRQMFRPTDGWVDSYVSLDPSGSDLPSIDFYEYYWANLMVGQISLQDVVGWLVKVSDGASKFYAENRAIVDRYEEVGHRAFRNGEFVDDWYVRMAGWPIRVLAWIGNPPVPFLQGPIRALLSEASTILVNYVGDIAIYTTTDERVAYFPIRQKILEGAVAKAKMLLANYERVIFVAHSLGSVIAYDTLNRLNVQMNAGCLDKELASRIAGFITFGSPLDKVAFYFREHTPDDQYVRRQILANLYSFKGRDLDLQANEKVLLLPGEALLDHTLWLNFWNEHDPVSGHLDFYRDVVNVCLPTRDTMPDRAHGAYFTDQTMFERILEALFPL